MTTLLLPLLLARSAAAQDAPAQGPDLPGIDAHGFVLAAFDGDTRDLLTLQRPADQSAGTWFGGGLFEFAKSPLMAETPEGERVQIVDNVFALNVSGGYVPHERIRIDVAVPLFLTATGLDGAEGVALGDMRLASMITLLAPSASDAGLGVGLVPWLDLPTGADHRFLGQSGVAGGVLAAATLEADALTLTGNLGTQLNPAVERSNLTGSDSLVAGIGAGWRVDDALGVSGEVRGLAPFQPSPRTGTGAPVEGIATVRYARDDGSHFVGGIATGMSPGIGSAAFRLFMGGGFGGGGSDVAQAPVDLDNDGVIGSADLCPDVPESLNGRDDADGCPEQDVEMSVVVTVGGVPVQGATVNLQGPIQRTETSQTVPLALYVPPESMWKAKAALGACLEGEVIKQVRGEALTLEVPLQFVPGGLVKIVVLDANGNPVPDGTATFSSADPHCVPEGGVSIPPNGTLFQDVGVGTHSVTIAAPGYAPTQQSLTISLGDEKEIIAILME